MTSSKLELFVKSGSQIGREFSTENELEWGSPSQHQQIDRRDCSSIGALEAERQTYMFNATYRSKAHK